MIILDENISRAQREALLKWKIKFKHIGYDLSYKGIIDENIIVVLHSLKQPTLFTWDNDLYHFKLLHKNYCIVYVDVKQKDVAVFTRKFLNNEMFDSKSQRMGKIVRITYEGIKWWEFSKGVEEQLFWKELQ